MYNNTTWANITDAKDELYRGVILLRSYFYDRSTSLWICVGRVTSSTLLPIVIYLLFLRMINTQNKIQFIIYKFLKYIYFQIFPVFIQGTMVDK